MVLRKHVHFVYFFLVTTGSEQSWNTEMLHNKIDFFHIFSRSQQFKLQL